MSISKRFVKRLSAGFLALCFIAAFMAVIIRPSVSQPRTAAQGPLLYTIKAPVSGLMTRDGPPPAGEQAYINSFVINVDWADIETSPGTYNWTPIDSQLQYATTRNMAVRLRFGAGRFAPQWLKNRVGFFYNCSSVAAEVGQPMQCGDVPKYWEQGFIDAYASMMAKLAERYDVNPVLREVTVGGCQTLWTETFFRKYADEQQRQNWANSGITADKDMNCHRKQIESHKVWKQTRSTLSVNPYDKWDGTTFVNDANFTVQMIDYCIQQLGKDHCVFGDNGMRSTYPAIAGYDCSKFGADTRNNNDRVLAKIHCEGTALYFQTATYRQIIDACSDLNKTIQGALDVGAASVELPQGYNNPSATYTDPCTGQTRSIALDAATLASWDAKLTANTKAPVPVYGPEPQPISTPPTVQPNKTVKPGTAVATTNGQAQILAGDLNQDGKIDDSEIAASGAQADQQLSTQNLTKHSQRNLAQAIVVLVVGMVLISLGVGAYFLLRFMHLRTITQHSEQITAAPNTTVLPPNSEVIVHPVDVAEPPAQQT